MAVQLCIRRRVAGSDRDDVIRPSTTTHAGDADTPPSPVTTARRDEYRHRSVARRARARLAAATRPTSVRGTRRRIDVRAGRRSATVDRDLGDPKPARSARRINSVSNRSLPKRHRRAIGATAARRIAFMPWVSETRSPNRPGGTGEPGGHELARAGRSSCAPAPRFEPTTIAGPSAPSSARLATSRKPRS